MNTWPKPYYQSPYNQRPSRYPSGNGQPQALLNGRRKDRLSWLALLTPFRSKKWPTLHPALAADSTTIRYDLKKTPQEDILGIPFLSIQHAPVTTYSVSHMRLISEAYPWTIDIVTEGYPITCAMVFDALHLGLQEPLWDAEWGFMVSDKKLRESIEKAAKSRSDKDGEKALKRIDYLGDNTHFKGLEKVEDFEKAKLLPGKQAVAETWVVKLST